MAKRKTVKKIVEQPKTTVDEVPAEAPVPEKKSGPVSPMSLFECMMRRRSKEK